MATPASGALKTSFSMTLPSSPTNLIESVPLPEHVAAELARLSTSGTTDQVDAVAIGSPHLSLAEIDALERRLAGRQLARPLYANTGKAHGTDSPEGEPPRKPAPTLTHIQIEKPLPVGKLHG